MAAISDTSPLILYARIGRLELLHELYDEILVPQAVWDEIMVDGPERSSALEIAALPWIHVTPLTLPIPNFRRQLDHGEREALALVLELGDPSQYLIMDDEQGRKEAAERGQLVVGSAGIVLLAKRESLVEAARPVLNELRTAGLYLTDEIVDFILSSAGE